MVNPEMPHRPGMPASVADVLLELAKLMDAMDDLGLFNAIAGIEPSRDREVQNDLRSLAAWFEEHPELATAAFDRMRRWTLQQ